MYNDAELAMTGTSLAAVAGVGLSMVLAGIILLVTLSAMGYRHVGRRAER